MALTKISRGLLSTGVSDSSDATAITIDSSERVGIGTSSPSKKLHVEISGDAALFDRTGSAGGVMQFASGGTVKGNVGVQSGGFGFGGGFRDPDLFITTGGQIVAGGTNADPLGLVFTGKGLSINEDSGTAFMQIDSGNGSRIDFGVGGSRNTTLYADANVTELGRTTNHPIAFKTNNTERMRIDSSGKVNIGTTGGDFFDVLGSSGTLDIGADGSAEIVAGFVPDSTNARNGRLRIAGTNTPHNNSVALISDASTNVGMALVTTAGGTKGERLVIDSVGNIKIGNAEVSPTPTTSAYDGAMIHLAQTNSSSTGTQIHMTHGTSGHTASDGFLIAYYSDNNAYYNNIESGSAHLFYTAGSIRYTINSSGGANGSDEKWKENIQDISYGLDTVKSLQPRKFNWKDSGEKGIGFIAQEVKPLIGEVITEPTEGGPYESGYMMNYSALTAVLTKAIQELSTKLEAAEARITALEG